MSNIMIIYDSKYGNTKAVAEKIGEGLAESGVANVTISKFDEVDVQSLRDLDLLIIGSPNHMGRQTKGIKKLIVKLGKTNPKTKFCVFDTYMLEDYEKAVKKMEALIQKEIPGANIALPGLSIRVDKMKGPVSEGEFDMCAEFARKIAGIMT